MAKALLGYAMSTDPRLHSQHTRLAAENRQLRQRITDLESALAAVQIENEVLSSLLPEDASTVLEPV